MATAEKKKTMGLTAWQDGDIAGWQRQGEKAAPSVHFLHGNGFCATTLLPLGLQLPQDWNLLFTDVPGHGGSKQPDCYMPNWLQMARHIGDALESRIEAPLFAVGHSLGGVMTLLLAAERPHLFKRIVLLDPVLFSPEIILLQRLMRKTGLWRYTDLVKKVAARRNHWPDIDSMKQDLSQKSLYKNWHPDALQAFVEHGTKASAQGGIELSCAPEWEASIFGSYPRGLWQAVSKIEIPVDIFVASKSYGFIERSARKAAKANKNIQWHFMDGVHCFPMEQPERTADVLLDLLR